LESGGWSGYNGTTWDLTDNSDITTIENVLAGPESDEVIIHRQIQYPDNQKSIVQIKG
jgi:hypothetical protein